MTVSKILTALVVNQELKIFHSHTAKSQTVDFVGQSYANAESTNKILEKEEAMV